MTKSYRKHDKLYREHGKSYREHFQRRIIFNVIVIYSVF